MKAIQYLEYGSADVLQMTEVTSPDAAAGEVKIDVRAVSVNPIDWKVRAGGANPITDFPYILGRDFSGIVSTVGEGVTDLKVGDAVFGVCDAGQEGAYAERIAIKSSIIALKPDGSVARPRELIRAAMQHWRGVTPRRPVCGAC